MTSGTSQSGLRQADLSQLRALLLIETRSEVWQLTDIGTERLDAL